MQVSNYKPGALRAVASGRGTFRNWNVAARCVLRSSASVVLMGASAGVCRRLLHVDVTTVALILASVNALGGDVIAVHDKALGRCSRAGVPRDGISDEQPREVAVAAIGATA